MALFRNHFTPVLFAERRYDPGVYLVYRGEELVYVGTSGAMRHRLRYHTQRKKWLRAGNLTVRFIRIHGDELRFQIERLIIRANSPRWNTDVR